jgi:hypothetical protein
VNLDHDDLMTVVRPPTPELPSAEKQWRNQRQVFHSHQAGQVPHAPIESGPVARHETCILNERGGHKMMGVNCPHFLNYNPEEITVVEL